MRHDDCLPTDRLVTPLAILRQRVDLWNRRFHDLASDLDRIETTIAELIGEENQSSLNPRRIAELSPA